MEPDVQGADAPEGPQAAATGLLFDTQAGTICGIKLGERGSSAINKLPFPDEEEREAVQQEFLKSIAAERYFLTPVPGVAGVKLGFSRFGGEFIEVQSTAKELRSIEGIGVGNTLGEFVAAFGNPVKTYAVGTGGMVGHIYKAGGMKVFAFSFRDLTSSTVTRIILQRGEKER